MLRQRAFAIYIAVGFVLLMMALASIGLASPALSKDLNQPQLQETQPPVQKSISDDTCLGCHGEPGLTLELESGQSLVLFVPSDGYYNSVHGELGYACVQCHTTVGDYPHPPFQAEDIRDAGLQLYEACQRCHLQQYTLTLDSVHADALEAGNRNAAICTDCHDPHLMPRLTDPQSGELLPRANEAIPRTCAQCHNAIYQKYLTSVHGSALVGEGNPDVPTCIDCHGVHNIADPTTSEFRLRSPEICAGCHTDPQLMEKYGLSTQVLSTYIADFHGTTVTLFQKQHPDQETNKPVCYDCHGVHDIPRTDDPQAGLQLRENLLVRCQICHPDATAAFPDAWLSHYVPTPERNSLVYFVDLFYKFFIPGVLGGMAILVALDIGGILRVRIKDIGPRFKRSFNRLSPLAGAKPPGEPPTSVPEFSIDPEESDASLDDDQEDQTPPMEG
jgi:hypothetical protein